MGWRKLCYFSKQSFNVIFRLKFYYKRHTCTVRRTETNGLASIFASARARPVYSGKKRKEHTRAEYTCRPGIWNSSFPSYFASPPNRRTILLYVAWFGMKFSLLLARLSKCSKLLRGSYAPSRRRRRLREKLSLAGAY